MGVVGGGGRWGFNIEYSMLLDFVPQFAIICTSVGAMGRGH